MNEQDIRLVVEKVLKNMENVSSDRTDTFKDDNEILLEMSGRHVHLNKEAVQALFGDGAVLTPKKELSQPGQFLSEQRVKVVTSKGEFSSVAVLGPERKDVQVELSGADCRTLGIKAPVNLSGDLSGAADVILVSEKGCYVAKGSAIIAKAHVHMNPCGAENYGVFDGEKVSVKVDGERPIIFRDVPVRVSENFMPAVHIDVDEANACLYSSGVKAYIVKQEGANG